MSPRHPSATLQPAGQIARGPQTGSVEPQWSALGQLTTPTTSRWAIIGETIFLPLIAVGLGLWLNPHDPLWTHGNFPWAWLAPVVLALRYGPLAGIGGAGMLLLALFALNPGGFANFPKQVYLGGLILVMVIGEFSSLWVARTRRAETVQRYLDQRLEFLTHQYYLLRLSHDRLEQDLISRPMAMRDALNTMRNLVTGDRHESDRVCATALLRLLAQYCQLEVASLHQVRNDVIEPEALGTLGTTRPLKTDDPLLLQAMESRTLCHISQSAAKDSQPSRYLIAAPLTNLNDECFGVLLVEHIPFFSLQDETLQTINLLLGYYADSLSVQALADPIRQVHPDCPPEFAFELQRLWHIRQISQVASAIVVLEIRNRPGTPDIAQQIQRQKRALDENWLIFGVDRSNGDAIRASNYLATLMPLSGAAAAEGYISRLEFWAHQRSGKSLTELGIFSHVLMLDQEEPLALLQRLRDIVHG